MLRRLKQSNSSQNLVSQVESYLREVIVLEHLLKPSPQPLFGADTASEAVPDSERRNVFFKHYPLGDKADYAPQRLRFCSPPRLDQLLRLDFLFESELDGYPIFYGPAARNQKLAVDNTFKKDAASAIGRLWATLAQTLLVHVRFESAILYTAATVNTLEYSSDLSTSPVPTQALFQHFPGRLACQADAGRVRFTILYQLYFYITQNLSGF